MSSLQILYSVSYQLPSSSLSHRRRYFKINQNNLSPLLPGLLSLAINTTPGESSLLENDSQQSVAIVSKFDSLARVANYQQLDSKNRVIEIVSSPTMPTELPNFISIFSGNLDSQPTLPVIRHIRPQYTVISYLLSSTMRCRHTERTHTRLWKI